VLARRRAAADPATASATDAAAVPATGAAQLRSTTAPAAPTASSATKTTATAEFSTIMGSIEKDGKGDDGLRVESMGDLRRRKIRERAAEKKAAQGGSDGLSSSGGARGGGGGAGGVLGSLARDGKGSGVSLVRPTRRFFGLPTYSPAELVSIVHVALIVLLAVVFSLTWSDSQRLQVQSAGAQLEREHAEAAASSVGDDDAFDDVTHTGAFVGGGAGAEMGGVASLLITMATTWLAPSLVGMRVVASKVAGRFALAGGARGAVKKSDDPMGGVAGIAAAAAGAGGAMGMLGTAWSVLTGLGKVFDDFAVFVVAVVLAVVVEGGASSLVGGLVPAAS
jgi:hypothetical protein